MPSIAEVGVAVMYPYGTCREFPGSRGACDIVESYARGDAHTLSDSSAERQSAKIARYAKLERSVSTA